MSRKISTELAVFVAVITLAIAMIGSSALAATPTTAPAFAQGGQQKKFTATLSSKDEVPPNNSKASGTAEFNVSSDGKTVSYKVDVKDINKVTMAHIHQGKKGENGPVVVTLFKSATPSGPMNGELAKGDATANKLEGPLKGKQISDLVKIMEDGNAYTNVHTEQNPKGEIRGQISK
jgi:hypothetical protein